METSAKDNLNIIEAFKKLINSEIIFFIFYFLFLEVYIDIIIMDISTQTIEKMDKGETIKLGERMNREDKTNEKKKCGC